MNSHIALQILPLIPWIPQDFLISFFFFVLSCFQMQLFEAKLLRRITFVSFQPFHHHILRCCSRTTGRSLKATRLPHGCATAAMELIDESAIFGLEDPNQKVVHASPGRNARGHWVGTRRDFGHVSSKRFDTMRTNLTWYLRRVVWKIRKSSHEICVQELAIVTSSREDNPQT